MRIANGQLADHNSLEISSKINSAGLEAIINTESVCLNHLLNFISKKNPSDRFSKKELKKILSKIKVSFIFKCINSKYNTHLKFRDLFNEEFLMSLFEVFIKTVKTFDKNSSSFNCNNVDSSFIELKNKIEINLSFISRTIKNKDKGLNSSDENELIHSAIKIERFKSNTYELSTKQITKICNHFNLKSKKDKIKFNCLYNLHHEKASLDSDQACIFKNIEDKNKDIENTINKKQEIDYLKLQSINFKKSLKLNDIKVFDTRVWNQKNDYKKLSDLSLTIGISPQALNQREKNIKENFIYFCKKNLKKKISG